MGVVVGGSGEHTEKKKEGTKKARKFQVGKKKILFLCFPPAQTKKARRPLTNEASARNPKGISVKDM